jgi:hypothetical protein
MPVRQGHDAGLDQVEPVEQGRHLRPGAVVQGGRGLAVDARYAIPFGNVVSSGVRNRQVAARGHGIHETGDDSARVALIRHEVEDGYEQYRDWLAEVQYGPQFPVAEDRVGLSQVVLDNRGPVNSLQHVDRMGDDDGVVIDIDNATALRDLVYRAHSGHPGAYVKELAYASFGAQVAYGPAEELPVLPGGAGHGARRHHGDSPLASFPVRWVIVLSAEEIVVHSRGTRNVRAENLKRVTGLHGPDYVTRQKPRNATALLIEGS